MGLLGKVRLLRFAHALLASVVLFWFTGSALAAPNPAPFVEAGEGALRYLAMDLLRIEAVTVGEVTVSLRPALRSRLPLAMQEVAVEADGLLRLRIPRARLAATLEEVKLPTVGTAEHWQTLGLKSEVTFVERVGRVQAARELRLPAGRVVATRDVASLAHLQAAFPDSVPLLMRSPDLSRYQLMRQPIRHVRLLAELPTTTSAFSAVHGTVPTEGQLRHVENAARRLSEVGAESIAKLGKPGESMADTVLRVYRKAAPGESVALMNHNANGVLRFPDRSELLISELDQVRKDVALVVMSCNGVEQVPAKIGGTLIGTTKAISYGSGADAIVPFMRTPGTIEARLRSVLAKVPVVAGIAGSAFMVDPFGERSE